MALADGILVWLSLQRLLPWLTRPGSLSPLARLRAFRLNDLSEDQLREGLQLPEFSKLPENYRYIGLSTYQGELSEVASFFLPLARLLRRALLLQDRASFQAFYRQVGEPDKDLESAAMRSNDPFFQAVVLRKNKAPYMGDVQAVRPTAGLRSLLDPNGLFPAAQGWFHFPPHRGGVYTPDAEDYVKFFLRAGGSLGEIPAATISETGATDENRLLVLGDQPLPIGAATPNEDLLEEAIRAASWHSLQDILGRWAVELPEELPEYVNQDSISPLLGELMGRYPQAFRNCRRLAIWHLIVRGQSVQEFLPEIVRDEDLAFIMVFVAHPDLTQPILDLASQTGDFLHPEGIIYDLEHYMTLRHVWEGNRESRVPPALYERGMFLRWRGRMLPPRGADPEAFRTWEIYRTLANS